MLLPCVDELVVVSAVFKRNPDGSRGELIETGEFDELFKKYEHSKDVFFGTKVIRNV